MTELLKKTIKEAKDMISKVSTGMMKDLNFVDLICYQAINMLNLNFVHIYLIRVCLSIIPDCIFNSFQIVKLQFYYSVLFYCYYCDFTDFNLINNNVLFFSISRCGILLI